MPRVLEITHQHCQQDVERSSHKHVKEQYILYLMFSNKGSRVFAPEYQGIIQQTPHIKYQTSSIVKIFLLFLLVVIGVIIVSAIFMG